jgi:putative hydroxymethylpyrimidine transport system substrate-binding protein
MTRLALVLTVLFAALLAGCGEREQLAAGGARPQPFRVVLDYFPNADHAGLYAAQAAGRFEALGLDVELQAPPDPSAPLRLLEAGQADMVVSYPPEVLLARDKGATPVVVGALVQEPLTSLIALPGSGIRRVSDLRGARVGTAGIPYQSAYLRTILDEAGIEPSSVKETNVGFNLTPAMLSGRVDATLGSFWNYEGVDLERRGRRPVVLRMDRLGVPAYPELVFAVKRDFLDEDGASKVRRFLQGAARGHADLREDPARGLDALLQANADLEPALQRAVIERTLPVFFPEEQRRPFGWIEPDAWTRYANWMTERELIARPDAPGQTNEFLPGEGFQEGVQELQR